MNLCLLVFYIASGFWWPAIVSDCAKKWRILSNMIKRVCISLCNCTQTCLQYFRPRIRKTLLSSGHYIWPHQSQFMTKFWEKYLVPTWNRLWQIFNKLPTIMADMEHSSTRGPSQMLIEGYHGWYGTQQHSRAITDVDWGVSWLIWNTAALAGHHRCWLRGIMADMEHSSTRGPSQMLIEGIMADMEHSSTRGPSQMLIEGYHGWYGTQQHSRAITDVDWGVSWLIWNKAALAGHHRCWLRGIMADMEHSSTRGPSQMLIEGYHGWYGTQQHSRAITDVDWGVFIRDIHIPIGLDCHGLRNMPFIYPSRFDSIREMRSMRLKWEPTLYGGL